MSIQVEVDGYKLDLPDAPEKPSVIDQIMFGWDSKVADFVAGMTDSYAVDMYRKLKGFDLPT